MKTISYLLLLAATLIPISAFAQMDTVYVKGVFATGSEGTLNDAISAVESADSLNHTDKLSNTVFKLTLNDQYVLTGTITVPLGETLNIVGPDPTNSQSGALPMILWTSSGNTAENFNFDCFGNIYLKNVWLLYATTNTGGTGTQVGSALEMEDDSLADLSGAGEHGTFDDVIFDYCPCPSNAGGSVTVAAKEFKGTFTNCFFRNDIDTHLRYYGRAVSFPYNSTGLHIDSVSFTNCTFANMGYVLMQEGAEYSSNVWFNHCTFLNIMMWPLESGWWKNLVVTNSIFVNPWMFGEQPASDTSGGGSGVFSIDSVSTFGFTPSGQWGDQDRHILVAACSYYYMPWLTDYMQNSAYAVSMKQTRQNDLIPQPDTMFNAATMKFFTMKNSTGGKAFPFMNAYDLYDGSNPGFIAPLTNQDSAKAYLYLHWSADLNANWAFEPDSDINQVWPLPGNLAYTNDTLKTASIGGYPLGDLYHWWPSEYYSWEKKEATLHTNIVSAQMDGMLTAIGDSINTAVRSSRSALPTKFALSQNYPNPFNPTTQIGYTVAKRGLVTLDVYNVLGEKVATLYSGVRQPGSYTATFDGSSLASGVYFYRLKAGSVSITKKLVLLK